VLCCSHSQVEVSHRSIQFPPCRPGERVHQTLLLVNYGDTPASFAFTNARGLAPVFQIRPAQGVIPAKSHVLVSGKSSDTGVCCTPVSQQVQAWPHMCGTSSIMCAALPTENTCCLCCI
jgi:hypothetical protein